MAWEEPASRNGRTLVGRPSGAAVEFSADHFGFSTKTFGWPDFFARIQEADPSVTDHRDGWRDTFYCTRR
jgi:hypothetical protein